MKTKALLLMLALVGSSLAEEPKDQPNPEIAKIDARLAELKTVWNQDTAEINRLTNFKRTPVKEGSPAYYACLKASQRIQQAEAEAKTLKEKKASLMGEPQEVGGNTSLQNGPQEKSKDFAVVTKAIPAVQYDRAKHGPKVKDFFIGMSMTDMAKNASILAEVPYKVCVTLQDIIVFSLPKGCHRIIPTKLDFWDLGNQSIQGVADQNGLVAGIGIPGAYSKLLFKATNMPYEKFVATFEDAYDVELNLDLRAEPPNYSGVTVEGVSITIESDFSIAIKKGIAPDETKKAFD